MTSDSDETRTFRSDAVSIQPFGTGETLSGRYRLGSELGRGGMGIVFRATDLQLHRQVAVKVLSHGDPSPGSAERLLHEARSAAALNHPHIVAVHDVGEDRGVPFFVMELVDGTSLDRARPRDLPEIVRVAIQICAALEHAHAHEIVHRDLKPENVLLSGAREPRVVKLADLGLAVASHRSRGGITDAGTIVGTAHYMAPEQALGQRVDGRADLYALGALLYELVTGRPPFTGSHPLEVVSQHVHAAVVPPRVLRPDLPPALETAILRLLAKDPAQRFTTATQASAAIARSLSAPLPDDGAEPIAAVALLDALSRGRMVGRVEELAEIRELWRRAREGSGHCVLLSGEPGAGKTRLAREALVQSAMDGAALLQGACYENEATTPYLPFVEAFRRWVREQPDDAALRQLLGDAAAQIAKLAPEIEARLGRGPDRPALAAHEERLLFFDAVASVFRALARLRGLLFYIDDLHWADSSTLNLLSHLLRQLKQERILVLVSYRDTDLDRAHPLARALDDWNRERLTTRIRLRRFDAAETTAQLEALLGETVGPDFSGAVHRETEGNPFFVEEVLKALIEQGSVRRESGRWKRAEMGEIAIPQSMKAAIGRRLDRVKPECNEALRAAAVLGKTFEFRELLAVNHGRDEDRLLDAVDQAVAAQLLVPGPGESFAFTHDKIREVLYEELNPIRRRRLHRRAAEGLESLRARGAVPMERLAHHYIEAGEHERGLTFATQAGADAEGIYAFDEAIAAYGRALECAEALGRSAEPLALEEAIGRAHFLCGNSLTAAEHFERALRLTRDPDQRARLQCLAANAFVTNGDARGLDHVHQALAVLDPVTRPVETAHAIAIEGRFHHLAGRHREAAALLEKAAHLAAPMTDGGRLSDFHATTLQYCYAFAAGAYQHLGLFDESARWARRAIEFGEQHDVPLSVAAGYEFLGENCINTGEFRAGLEFAAREREIIRRVPSRERLAWSSFVVSMCSMFLGDAVTAEREFVDGIALAASIGERRLQALLTAMYGRFLADQGRLDDALTTAADGVARASALNLTFLQTEAERCLAHVRFKRGEIDEAARLCAGVLAALEGKEPKVTRLFLGPLHVQVLLAAQRLDEARSTFHEYAAVVAECQSPIFTKEVERLRALLAQL